ncbi:MAG: TraR/DksA C4-type zinc finger protein [Dehalococcoidales bacterium]|nr:TraR/DksA C4-type zinc finger protein [Dehalococcoidales bacterium]MDD3264798.1 TraR/DksA C4-type zinc finger protein [Dehalococcoidales bacterium]MDD4322259.1 TraR/DksA C4-type zinc finger protein [Dehalococcoidales bacterium]MDD4794369.1 TraR/DksA C4-type zinc finger protein [Dehalococcoidales bacterium]MDD5122051.1 TraR/DksA C4-type zinc finger protein [Dehalococcoidales bacterium]
MVEKKYKPMKEKLEADLLRLKEQLEQIRDIGGEENRREGSPYGKKEEEAAETADIENRLAMEKRLIEQIMDVEVALEKFGNGTYGICEKCGKAIAYERLEFIPQARLCVSCKSAK